ncbi:F420-dependent NADP reductase [Actinoplanes sp. SE50]|uniref:NADPH-dependent F420 reductase n=1 Tax=unclassified Actinoplanes TaxID=2626549 RepID=UPI00023EC14A|nr:MULTISPECIES: NAD(P)-binding domain-containing protein [unclassified Actinoplanes]AEV86341.1 Glycerol-3-phosphate dehydrogenase [Actinoplanes sp. SE50/110]ATO84738.1 F420-dependent NADP reductase [Actinoplanes sp. SE50]SLM02148.1 F420-dependent NADP reductase [Actinoplanes sp. SE50/110]
MRIGVIGAGQLGGTLATWCAESGHDVAVTSRHPDRLTDLVEHGDGHIRAMTIPEAAVFGEMLFFAPNWDSAREAIDIAHDAMAGKVVIDATNPSFMSAPTEGMMPGAPGPGGLGAFAPGFPSALEIPAFVRVPDNPGTSRELGFSTKSGFETLIDWAPEAHWAKAFNTISTEVLDRRRGHDPLLAEFVCTNQRDAREAACRIIQELGFAPFFAGGPEAARLTETGGPLQMREVDVYDAKDVLAEALAAIQ